MRKLDGDGIGNGRAGGTEGRAENKLLILRIRKVTEQVVSKYLVDLI